MVARGLGIDTSGAEQVAVAGGDRAWAARGRARSGRRTLLIVDEAQALQTESLEELRMLSNFQAGGMRCCRSSCSASPSSALTLHGSDRLEQLRQRVIAMHHLDPMDAEEVEPYLLHRLSLRRLAGQPRFTHDALGGALSRVGRRAAPAEPARRPRAAVRRDRAARYVRRDRAGGGDRRSRQRCPGTRRTRSQPCLGRAARAARHRTDADGHADAAEPVEARPLRAETVVETPAPVAEAPLDRRIAELEARFEEQDAALRRVLTLLVDWVESGDSDRRPRSVEPARTRRPEPHGGNGLSVDVEDWFQVGAFESVIAKADWDGLEQRVECNTERCSACSARAGCKATFFTLGWVAKRYPALIRRIAEAGHEVASHGWDHERVFTMDRRSSFAPIWRERGRRWRMRAGQKVTGYRAPSFSIDHADALGARRCWPRRAIVIRRASRRSGTIIMAGPMRRAAPIARSAGAELIELPITLASVRGASEITTGGGFFRLLPGGDHRYARAHAPMRRGTPGGLLFPSLGSRSRPAARRQCAAQVEAAALQPARARWRASCEG